MGKVIAIIPAAGKGKRMGGQLNKQFLMLNQVPALIHTLQVFAQIPLLDEIIVVSASDEIEYCRNVIDLNNVPKVSQVVAGGNERQQSVYNGLLCCPEDTDIVLIHDGARPLITKELINVAIDSAREFGAVSVAVPVKDTVKVVDEQGFVLETPERDHLWLIQTPQAFHYDIIMKAHRKALKDNFTGTDDAGLVENTDRPVKLIMGSYENIKITTPEDLILAEAILTRRINKCG